MEKNALAPKRKGRTPVVAGLFYPEDRALAEARLCSYGLLGGIGDNAAAIVAPHGAWDISGAIAGAAFSAAAGRVRRNPSSQRPGKGLSRVLILGSLHEPEEEGIFLSDSHYFETPLGNLPVDKRLSAELASCNTLFEINDIPHLREHTIEVLLPFVKFCFPDTKIIPLLLGNSRPALISALARALFVVFKNRMEDTLFVVSANLSKNTDEKAARDQAEECVRLLEENRAGSVGAALTDGRINPCGGGALAALLESGLLAGKTGKLVSGPLINARGEEDKTVYYGGISFE
ncbi:MAG: AmmeMemoRadiSam system protein B [Spirochaetaceae bacterium]|jgi:AmmeMemoRadiSam system protein B|nr:AmmeMemoRadiSam system protein B [Spirochaetaceae bacterium]